MEYTPEIKKQIRQIQQAIHSQDKIFIQKLLKEQQHQQSGVKILDLQLDTLIHTND